MSDIERADRLSRRRARALPMLALIFLLQQTSYLTNYAEEGTRAVDHVRIGAWLALSIVLLLALATNGFWFQSRAMRALLDDEVTRSNRAEAMRLGFIAAMVAGMGVYGLAFVEPLSAHEAVHIVMTAGLAVALIRFGMLERRALRDER